MIRNILFSNLFKITINIKDIQFIELKDISFKEKVFFLNKFIYICIYVLILV